MARKDWARTELDEDGDLGLRADHVESLKKHIWRRPPLCVAGQVFRTDEIVDGEARAAWHLFDRGQVSE